MAGPSGDQTTPFQRATVATATPAISYRVPPATRSPLPSSTTPRRMLGEAVSIHQMTPFQRIAQLLPTATTSPFAVVQRPMTSEGPPVPSADQATPSQSAMWSAPGTPPASRNEPPITRPPFGRTTSALTVPRTPVPSADHVVPFQRAIRFAG